MKLDHSINKMINRGFGMVEVMIAAAMLGVVSLGVMKLIEMQATGNKNAAQTSEINLLHNEVVSFLAQEEVATFNFQGLSPNTETAITNLRRLDNSTKYQAGNDYGNPKIQIQSMQIGGSFEQIGSDSNFGRTPFEIHYAKTSGSNTRQIKREFSITVRLNGGVIETAQATAGASGSDGGYWIANPNGIHYGDGNVGIGTTTPDQKLQVEGWIKAKTGYDRYIEIGGDGASDDYEIRLDSDRPITIWDKANSTTGSMILNMLKFKNQANAHGSPCDANQEGNVRYNNTSKTLEVCQGSSYQTIGPFVNRCTWRHSIKVASDYYNHVNCNANEMVVSGSCSLPNGSASNIYSSVALTNMGHRCGAPSATGNCSRWWCGVSPNAANIEVNALCCQFDQ